MFRAPVKSSRVFLLSPANCSGLRCQMVLRDGAKFPLALAVQSAAGAPLGEVFRFTSGLYFRGKWAYAMSFAAPPKGVPGSLVITPGRGLVPPETYVTANDLRAFAKVDVDEDNPKFRKPLLEDAKKLASKLGPRGEVVLLGSIATGKYTRVLTEVFGERLLFPESFVGRGDMSRGGLLLRSVREKTELTYAPVLGATVKGTRPPKLPPLRGIIRETAAVFARRR
ncbi:MAG: hypothetical protein ACJ790_02885 [Myxococcaceae bacterium]